MDIIYLDNTTSTSDYLLNLHTDKEVVAVADYQSAGRGAGSNKWESEPGKNLLFSMLIHPTWLEPRNQFLMSMIHALALVDVLSAYDSHFTIKWPNDIYWHDKFRTCSPEHQPEHKKISGTIIDCTLKGGKIADMVIGTGININQETFHSDAPNPVSLYQITGKKHDSKEILEKLIERFKYYLGKGSETIIKLYDEWLYRREGFYTYEDKEGRFEAELVQVLPSGIMQLRRKDGTISSYEFKEVKFII